MSISDIFHPPILDVVNSVIATASLVAAATPNKFDNIILKCFRAVVDVLALNFGGSKNEVKR